MATLLFTGFPGQLGSELVPRILFRPGREEALCLVQPKFVEKARDEVRRIVADDPSLRGGSGSSPGISPGRTWGSASPGYRGARSRRCITWPRSTTWASGATLRPSSTCAGRETFWDSHDLARGSCGSIT